MRKKIFIAVLAIVFAVTVIVFMLPFVMGFAVEKKVPAVLHTLSSKKMTLQLVKYQRSWFGAIAKINVIVRPPWTAQASSETKNTADNQPKIYHLIARIVHGPLLYLTNDQSHSQFAFGLAAIRLYTDNTLNLRAHARLSLTGKVMGHVNIPHLKLTLAPGVSAAYQDLAAAFTINSALNEIRGRAHIANAATRLPDWRSQISGVKADYVLTKYQPNFWLREQNFTIKHILVHHGNKGRIQLEGINGHVKTHIAKKGKLNTQMQLSFVKAITATQQLGPYHLDLSVNDIDISALMELLQFFENNKTMAFKKIDKSRQKQFNALMLNLLSKGATIAVKQLNLATEVGNIAANAQLVLPQQMDNKNLLAMIVTASGQLHLSVPKSAVTKFFTGFYQHTLQEENEKLDLTPSEAAQKQIQHLLQTGWLMSSGDRLALTINYKDAALLINGKSLKDLGRPLLFPKTQDNGAQTKRVEEKLW